MILVLKTLTLIYMFVAITFLTYMYFYIVVTTWGRTRTLNIFGKFIAYLMAVLVAFIFGIFWFPYFVATIFGYTVEVVVVDDGDDNV